MHRELNQEARVEFSMNAKAKTSRELGMVKVPVFIPLAFIAIFALTFGFYEARKAYWDYQVDKLCDQDGWLKIREEIHLDPQVYESLIDKKFGTGEIIVPPKGSSESRIIKGSGSNFTSNDACCSVAA